MKASFGPTLLLAVAVLFCLPFVEFSCKGRPVVTLSGYEAAFGKKAEAHFPIEEWLKARPQSEGLSIIVKEDRRSDGNGWVLLALIASVTGGVAAWFWRPIGVLGGIAAVVFLLVAQADVQDQVKLENVSLLTVTFQFGFWASMACAGLGAMACFGGRSSG